MISDTLFDAAQEIRRYQWERRQLYSIWEADIAHVLATMDALRIKLDTPPSPSPGG